MKNLLLIIAAASLVLCAIGCGKEEEVGYGGKVETVPGATAPAAGSKPMGNTPSVD